MDGYAERKGKLIILLGWYLKSGVEPYADACCFSTGRAMIRVARGRRVLYGGNCKNYCTM